MTFTELGLNARMVSRLDALGLTAPTPIQQKAIPHALQGRDILGIAQTGTGKTAAFGIPLVVALSKAQEKAAPKSARGLILAPTRELANQIVQTLRALTADLRITLVVGGKSVNVQTEKLSRGTDILVATPGRLIDLLDRGAVELSGTRFLVLDEADQMLDIGFIHALRRIAPMLGKDRQTMMFSATMPKVMEELSRHYLDKPIRVEASPPGKVADKVTHSVHFVPKERKQDLLIELLNGHRNDRALVFSRTKHGAERLMNTLERAGFAATSIHGNKSQGQRDRAIAAFSDGSVRVLVATDVAARGLDIPDVGHVYNYDLPNVPENYVHRIGRTARAGKAGRAIAFCDADEVAELTAIEKALGASVDVAGGRPWTRKTRRASRSRNDDRAGVRRDARSGWRPNPRSRGACATKRPRCTGS
jgi:ATP-dependent RNA helicase RhlE